ncbi:MAG TPA: hypothetical protein VIG64_00620 [Actinomycetota bacterium]|jgi:hypothetical protein
MARQAWRLYRQNIGGLFLTVLPFFVLAAVVFYVVVINVEIEAGNVLLLVLSRDMLHIVVASFAVGAGMVLVADRLAGNPGRAGASVRETLGSGGTILPLAVLGAIPYCLTFFILGPFLRELFVGPPIVITAVVIERRRFGDALARARELLAENWSRTLLYLITFAAGAGLLDFVIQQLALRAVTGASTDVLGYVLAIAVSVIVPSLVMPYVACAWLIAYFDLRARAEDFDAAALPSLRPTTPQ